MDNHNLQVKAEDQMEVTTLTMMQVNQLLFDFCGSNNDVDPSLPSSVFSSVSESGSLSNLLDSSPVTSPSSFPPNPPSTVPLTVENHPLHGLLDKTGQPDVHSSCSARNRWRNTRELFSTNALATSIEKQNSMAAMRELVFRIAAMQPIHIDPESVKPPKRRNVKISKDPQSIAARHRRERISERIRILQRLVPGGTKMDTASMLDEAIHYVKFLKTQVQSLERVAANRPTPGIGLPWSMSIGGGSGSRPNLSPAQTYQAPQSVHDHDPMDA